jgi:hypothetical protein
MHSSKHAGTSQLQITGLLVLSTKRHEINVPDETSAVPRLVKGASMHTQLTI